MLYWQVLVVGVVALAGECVRGWSLPYVIGGDEVTDSTKWPWQGSHRRSGSHTCGCSLISTTWAVTAAHCVSPPVSVVSLKFGSTSRLSGGTVVNVLLAYKHEEWTIGDGSFPNDIAVLKFAAIALGDSIKPISLASTDQAGNPACYITGWGYTTEELYRELPTTLQQAKVNVYNNTFCNTKWTSGQINDGHVCLGDEVAGRGSCNGDSGGPLVCKVGTNWQLVGVTSFGIAGCGTHKPSVYTRIAYFKEWVESTTGI